MIWPPVKAWTSKLCIEGQTHFVAINYGGKLLDRWVILMSVIDSSIVVKVCWSHLIDPSYWKSGWLEDNYSKPSELFNKKSERRTDISLELSNDSGLTIPITKDIIRPWFGNT